MNTRELLLLVAVIVLVCAIGSPGAGAEEYNHYFSRSFGDASEQMYVKAATDPDGNVILTGYFQGTVNFGGGALTSAGSSDIFLAKFDRFGNHLWSRRFGDADHQYGQAVAIDASSYNIIITGTFYGTVNFGGGALTSKGSQDIYVAQFDKNGTFIWNERFGGASSERARGVAVDASGNFALAGDFWGELDFGGGTLTSAGEADIFIVCFGANHSHLWSRRFGDASSQLAMDVAIDNGGNVVMGGYFAGVVNFGGETHTSAGNDDVFLAKFRFTDGEFGWSKRFGDSDSQQAWAVAADGSGNVIITGDMYGTVNFGGGAITSAGAIDVFVAKFQPNGVHLWSKRFGDADLQGGQDVAADAEGNVILTGYVSGSADFGGGLITGAGQGDAFLAAFDASGSHIWSKLYGDASAQAGTGVAADVSGNVVAVGRFKGAIDFGGGALTCGGSWDIFLAKLFFATPRIVSCADIPNDEGGLLRVRLLSSFLDREGSSIPITGYTAWRKIVAAAALPDVMVSPDRAALLGLPPGSWESVGFAFATQDSFYNFAIPTMADSTASGIPWETYIVTAHTATPSIYFTSRSADGYSVDNLPPVMPLGLEGEQRYSPAGLDLSWTPNVENDLAWYNVYRGTSEGFVPGPSNRIGTSWTPGFFDDEWDWSAGYYYKVAAVDRHGNESGHALLAPDDVTGVETPKAPAASYLAQNFPNPFNPVTRISFGLAAPADISLRIFDVSGRLVRVLIEGARPAGNDSELWDGRDSGGRAVASGIYFYRLTAGSFTETRKMALLR